VPVHLRVRRDHAEGDCIPSNKIHLGCLLARGIVIYRRHQPSSLLNKIMVHNTQYTDVQHEVMILVSVSGSGVVHHGTVASKQAAS
jgi:hypothetical protein